MKKLFPVIHAWDQKQIKDNCVIAKENLADGVFLINYGRLSFDKFEKIVSETVSEFQNEDFRVGVNWLEHWPDTCTETLLEALELVIYTKASMLWSDNAGSDLDWNWTKFQELKHQSSIDFYGGVHFKYQKPSKYSLKEAIGRVQGYTDVITLSGPATGVKAEVSKIQEAAKYLPGVRLALASGITLNNVSNYLPYVDHYLVASSLIDYSRSDSEYFDENQVQQLAKKIHQGENYESVESKSG